MATPTRDSIARDEFDRRLDALNERRQNELQQREGEQDQIECMLGNYEHVLDEIEAKLRSGDDPNSYPARIRRRLEELAKRTAELASSL